MKLESIFISFRNHSFEEIIKLNLDGVLSDKEKLLLRTVCENATNEINTFIKEVEANKTLGEGDFDWSMKMYVFICVQVFFDIFDRIKKADDPHVKALQNVDKQDLIKKMKKIFSGPDIDVYVDKAYRLIEETSKEAKTYEDFIIGRTYMIFKMLKENKVHLKELSKDNLLSIAEKNYQDSLTNFVKTCI
ncbi:MAG: hypothetical protein JWN89_458 [Parcubacteria group bacterium]|nr:hypothetical protein [Parcubacteria group bacterium]